MGQGGEGTIYRISSQAINQLKNMPSRLVAKTMTQRNSQKVQNDIRVLLQLGFIDPEHRYHWPVTTFLYNPSVTTIQNATGDKMIGYTMAEAEGDLWKVYQTKRYPIETIHTFCRHILSALKYIHERDMAHGDVKAENVLISQSTARLSDCGGVDLKVQKLESAPPTTLYFLPSSAYDDPRNPHTWVHVDKYAWVVMVLLQLNHDPTKPAVSSGVALPTHIQHFSDHPLWPDVVPIMNHELTNLQKPLLSVPLHQQVSHTLQEGWETLANVLKGIENMTQ